MSIEERLRDRINKGLDWGEAQEELFKTLEDISLRDPDYILELMGARTPVRIRKRRTSEKIEDTDANGLADRE